MPPAYGKQNRRRRAVGLGRGDFTQFIDTKRILRLRHADTAARHFLPASFAFVFRLLLLADQKPSKKGISAVKTGTAQLLGYYQWVTPTRGDFLAAYSSSL